MTAQNETWGRATISFTFEGADGDTASMVFSGLEGVTVRLRKVSGESPGRNEWFEARVRGVSQGDFAPYPLSWELTLLDEDGDPKEEVSIGFEKIAELSVI